MMIGCLGGGAPSVMQVQAQASRTLQFLQVIEATIERYKSNTDIMATVLREVEELRDWLRRETPQVPLDLEGRAARVLHQAGETAERVYLDTVNRLETVRRCRDLLTEGDLEDALASFIEVSAATHNACMEARDTLQVCNALHSPRGEKVYEDPDELMSDILAGR